MTAVAGRLTATAGDVSSAPYLTLPLGSFGPAISPATPPSSSAGSFDTFPFYAFPQGFFHFTLSEVGPPRTEWEKSAEPVTVAMAGHHLPFRVFIITSSIFVHSSRLAFSTPVPLSTEKLSKLARRDTQRYQLCQRPDWKTSVFSCDGSPEVGGRAAENQDRRRD